MGLLKQTHSNAMYGCLADFLLDIAVEDETGVGSRSEFHFARNSKVSHQKCQKAVQHETILDITFHHRTTCGAERKVF